MSTDHIRGRRRFLIVGSAVVAGLTLGRRDIGAAQPLPLTPECKDGDEPTPRQTEGPFFKLSSPERSNLVEPGLAGRPLDVSGFVLDRNCKPMARALIDVWQADTNGNTIIAASACAAMYSAMPMADIAFAPFGRRPTQGVPQRSRPAERS